MTFFDIDNSSPPVTAVRFSNGTITNGEVEVNSHVHVDDKSRNIVTAKAGGMTYVGQNFGAANRFPTTECDYYMGIHDKSTGKIRVVPASLIQMDPWFEDKEKDEENVEKKNKTFHEKISDLTTGFGSGKSKRLVEKHLREKLDDDVVTKTAMSMVDQTPTSHLEVGAMSISDVIPPHNKDAQTPDEVYKLKDLITTEVLVSLTEVASVFTAQPVDMAHLKEKKFFNIVMERVDLLSKEPVCRLLQGRCLMYLQYMMHMYLMKHSELRLQFPLPKAWPQTVRDYLLHLFTLEIKEPGKRLKRTMPSHKKDQMLAHIIVLCLKISDNRLDLTPLVEDLKLPARKLLNMATSLGCKVKKSKQGLNDGYTATLTVPLTFPTPASSKGKGKGQKRT